MIKVNVVVIVLSVVFVACLNTFACGPFFDTSYVSTNYDMAKAVPETVFLEDCAKIVAEQFGPEPEPSEQPEIYDQRLEQQTNTFNAAVADFSEAVASKGNAKDLVESFTKLTESLKAAVDAELSREQDQRNNYETVEQKPAVFDLASVEPELAKFPAEFEAYFRGAVAYHQQRYKDAIKAFSGLLKLPEPARKYRSVWAAFMLGKCWAYEEPRRAPEFYTMCRDLADAGFKDSLNLAGDSLGWQARAEYWANDFVNAIHHYAECRQIVSLKIVCQYGIFVQENDLVPLANDTLARRIVTAFVLSRGGPYDYETKPELLKRWCAAFDALKEKENVADADRLAWCAYHLGDMELAKSWLKYAHPDAPVAQWLQSKLLLREGDIAGAASLLEKAASAKEAFDFDVIEEGDLLESKPAWRHVTSDYATVCVMRGEYEKGCLAFLTGRNWDDAALVAERIMTLDESADFLKRHYEEFAAAQKGENEYENVYFDMNYLLARRMAREGKWELAMAYYPDAFPDNYYFETPPALKDLAKDYVNHVSEANDTKRPARERAESLFAAAKILREQGMELTGTSLEPDWGIGGYYSLGPISLTINEDITTRMKASAASPDKRFHYRYRAAEMMKQCADMLPDNDPLTAEALYLGGMWLSKRDPESADPFYKALVRRNPNLRIAREADALRWFPKEFTDAVLYTARAKPLLPVRKRDLAIGGGVVVVLVAAGLGMALIRRRKSSGNESE